MKKLIVVLAILALAVPASAADWSFSGDARMQTYSATFSKELVTQNRDDTDTVWAKSDVLSRFTATVKSGDVMGYIQLRPFVANPFRHWFGEWDFGSGKLLVGKTWAVNTYFTNNQNFNENYYGAFGNLNDIRARVDQIQLKFGGLQLGFLTPYTGRGNNFNTLGTDALTGITDTDATIPLIEAAYTFKMDTMQFKINAGYQTYDIDLAPAAAADDQTQSIDSYVIGGAWLANFGAFYANVEAHYGQNLGNLGQNIYTDQYADRIGTTIYDNTGYAYNLTLGFKINDMFTIEGGYGYIYGEDDLPAPATSDQNEDEGTAYYVQFPITLADGVFLIPEMGKFDFGDRDLGAGKVDQGEVTYWGANWKIAF